MEQNHELWSQIQNIQNGVTPAVRRQTLETLEKQRLQRAGRNRRKRSRKAEA
jgi:hypothetical protein